MNDVFRVSESSDANSAAFSRRVLAPFAVDQAADLCSCGHENDDSAAGLVWGIIYGVTRSARRAWHAVPVAFLNI